MEKYNISKISYLEYIKYCHLKHHDLGIELNSLTIGHLDS